jgi:dihydrofolate reductase
MRKLIVFNNVTIDGYFTDKSGDMSWAHENNDAEFNSFVQDNAKSGGELIFGRITYEMMASFWPTPMALEMNPLVAKRMNSLPKVVFSRTLSKASWSNTRLISGDLITEIKKLKGEKGKDLVILGSGKIVSQLAKADLIDQFQLVLNPIVLGGGRTLFEGMRDNFPLKLSSSHVFKNGKVFLLYSRS